MRLRHGLAELKYANGAAVILEVPARCVLDSPSRLTLQNGRLSAQVPVEAIGFTVCTPTAMLVDLGTEFGVSSERAVLRMSTFFADRLH